MRKSSIYLTVMALNIVLLCLLIFIHPSITSRASEQRRAEQRRLVRDLGIADLCLFTEARYTRHLSQADLHSAFQDHPMSFEHFPSGSVVAPPAQLGRFDGGRNRGGKIADTVHPPDDAGVTE